MRFRVPLRHHRHRYRYRYRDRRHHYLPLRATAWAQQSIRTR